MPVPKVILVFCFLWASSLHAQLHNFGWVQLQGGKTIAATYAVTSDQHGSTYFTGTMSGMVNFGGVTLVQHGASDAFIGKLTNAGILVWAAQLGASNAAQPSAIALDHSGNTYITGVLTDSTDFGITPPLVSRIFLAKFSPAGNLIWSLTGQNGSTSSVAAVGLAVSQSGKSVYLEATSSKGAIFQGFDSVRYNVPAGMYTIRLDSSGRIKWLKTDTATSRSLCLDSSENLYIGGGYFGTNSIGGIKITPTKSTIAFGFAASYDSAGKIRWVRGLDSLGPSTLCYGNGYLFGSNAFTSGSGSTVIAVRVPTSGSAVKYLRNSNGGVPGNVVVADGLGHVYMTGPLPVNIIIDTVKSFGGSCYVMRIDTSLRARWVTTWYDVVKSNSYSPCIAVDTSRGLVLSGTISGQTRFGNTVVTAKTTNGFVGVLTLQDLTFTIPAQTVLCPGDTIFMDVRTEGPFYLANKFDVQLSDSLGRFTAYQRIGEIVADGSTSVPCVIPITLHSGSKYRLRVYASSPVLTTVDNGFDLAVHSPPAGSVSPVGSIDICENDSVTITAVGGVAYRWSTGDTTRSIVAKTNGKYYVWVFGANGCVAKPAPTTVTMHLLPPVPAITQAGSTLFSNSTTNNQWNRNGTPIAGATKSSYTPTRSGIYSVTVSNAYKCSVTSDGVEILLDDDVEKTAEARFARVVSPGVIMLGDDLISFADVTITDILGATIAESESRFEDGKLDLSAVFQRLPNGVYFIRVQTEGRTYCLRFVLLR